MLHRKFGNIGLCNKLNIIYIYIINIITFNLQAGEMYKKGVKHINMKNRFICVRVLMKLSHTGVKLERFPKNNTLRDLHRIFRPHMPETGLQSGLH